MILYVCFFVEWNSKPLKVCYYNNTIAHNFQMVNHYVVLILSVSKNVFTFKTGECKPICSRHIDYFYLTNYLGCIKYYNLKTCSKHC